MVGMMRVVVAVLPLLALTACAGATPAAVTVTSTAHAYTGPLSASPSPTSDDALVGWPGAAGRVVQCRGPVIGTTRSAPYDGEDIGSTPEAALQAARSRGDLDGVQQGFALARAEAARRLYVFEVGGVAKQAVILRHGPALKGDGSRATVTRWWLESWARCDYAELPDAVARQRGTEIWTDADGRRALTSAIESFAFSAGCFPGMRALDIGGPVDGGWNRENRSPVEYIRRPAPELRDEYFSRDYREHVAVPPDAVDSGYSRAGQHLWYSEDRGAAYVGTRNDAEVWPRASQPIRCA